MYVRSETLATTQLPQRPSEVRYAKKGDVRLDKATPRPIAPLPRLSDLHIELPIAPSIERRSPMTPTTPLERIAPAPIIDAPFRELPVATEPLRETSDSASEDISLPLFKNRTLWQDLIRSALEDAGRPQFTQASRSFFAPRSPSLIKTFFYETSEVLWETIPQAKLYARKLLAEGAGPLVKLKDDELFESVGTTTQYRIEYSPGRQQYIETMRQRYAAKFGFHGSPLSCWHQILLQGLENKSNTKMQANGANYGDGVYLAQDMFVSRNFAGSLNQRRVIGLADVILGKGTQVHYHPTAGNQFYVVQNRSLVAVRYLFVYDPGVIIPDINTTSLRGHHRYLLNRYMDPSAKILKPTTPNSAAKSVGNLQ